MGRGLGGRSLLFGGVECCFEGVVGMVGSGVVVLGVSSSCCCCLCF